MQFELQFEIDSKHFLEIQFRWNKIDYCIKTQCLDYNSLVDFLNEYEMFFFNPDEIYNSSTELISLSQLKQLPAYKQKIYCDATFQTFQEKVNLFVNQTINKRLLTTKDAYLAICYLHFISKMYDPKAKCWCFYPYFENTKLSFVQKDTKSVCTFCHVPSETKFKLCGSCKSKKVYYCSIECQHQHWPEHKQHCEKANIQKRTKTYICSCCCFLSTTKFKMCGGCKPNKVRYCSRECQKLHWPRHKQYCHLNCNQQ